MIFREGGGQPNVLQQVTVRIHSNDDCNARYGRDAPGGIAEHMLCASYPGKDACSVRDLHSFVAPLFMLKLSAIILIGRQRRTVARAVAAGRSVGSSRHRQLGNRYIN